jgi:hypothetical protein
MFVVGCDFGSERVPHSELWGNCSLRIEASLRLAVEIFNYKTGIGLHDFE